MIIALGLIGCGGTKKSALSRTEQCKENFDNVQKNYDEKDYHEVIEFGNELLNKCTGTGFMEETQFLVAQSHFYLEDYLVARAEYDNYVSFYPSAPHVEISHYKMGISSYHLPYDEGIDGSYTDQGITDLEVFKRKFPSSTKLDSANMLIGKLVSRKAVKELNIAKLYLKMHKPQAAAIYLKDMLELYPNSDKFFEAMELLISCYVRLDQFEQAYKYADKLAFLSEGKGTGINMKSIRDNISSKEAEFRANVQKQMSKDQK